MRLLAQNGAVFNSNATCIEVEHVRFTDELLAPAGLAYAALGLSDRDTFLGSKPAKVPDSRFEADEGEQ